MKKMMTMMMISSEFNGLIDVLEADMDNEEEDAMLTTMLTQHWWMIEMRRQGRKHGLMKAKQGSHNRTRN